jgi:defect-in-organelle-trafficking protein DotA
MIKRVINILCLLGLACFVLPLFAAEIIDPVADKTDLSIQYLSQVFGTVGSTLVGTSGQMLGTLFQKLNQGVLLAAGLWLSYSIGSMAIRAGIEGSFLGANKNAHWVIMRIVLAFGMLLPNPTTGYSTIQDIVMKVVVQGINLADQTWSAGLDYIDQGGAVWISPVADGKNNPVIHSSDLKDFVGEKPAQPPPSAGKINDKTGVAIFQMQACMIASSAENDLAVDQPDTNGVVNTGARAVHYHSYQVDQQINFPGDGDARTYQTDKAHGCGTVSYSTLIGDFKKTGDPDAAAFVQPMISEYLDGIQRQAERVVCRITRYGGTKTCSALVTHSARSVGSSELYTASMGYLSAQIPHLKVKTSGNNYTGFITDAKKSGWILAGRYYWNLARAKRAAKQAMAFKYPEIKGPAPASADVKRAMQQAEKNFLSLMGASDGSTPHSVYALYANSQSTQDKKDQSESDLGKSAATIVAIAAATFAVLGPAGLIIAPIIADLVAVLTEFTALGSDPILFLHTLGMHCLGYAGDLFVVVGIGLFLFSLVGAVCQSVYNVNITAMNVFSWLKPPLFACASMLFLVGALLGFYVPLYPFIVFTFAVVSWFISVIEAMVSAPLITLGLTHPEGHDFLGECKQALILLLGVFLRPVLLVIGLISAMILSYVVYRFIIMAYSGFMLDIFNFSGHGYDDTQRTVLGAASEAWGQAMVDTYTPGGVFIMIFLGLPMMLIIFCSFVYVATTQCYSLIYVLPDYVLRWIGGPQQQSHVPEMARQMQGAITSGAQSMGQGLSGMSPHWPNRDIGKKSEAGIDVEEGGDGAGGGSSEPPAEQK